MPPHSVEAEAPAVDLRVSVGGVELATPLILASGTWGYGPEALPYLDYSRVGALSPKGITRHPRAGNPEPRVRECNGGLLNSVGLENVGIEAFIADKLPLIRDYPTKRVVNFSGSSVEEFAEMAAMLAVAEGVDVLEANLSCPNVKAGGAAFGTDEGLVRETTAAVRGASRGRPVWIKLSPNVTSISTMARAARDTGADAVTVANSFLGLSFDTRTRRPVFANVVSGYSGPAIKPMMLRLVYEVARELPGFPVVGLGGVMEAEDAVEYFLAGACAFGVGTAALVDPRCAGRIVDGLEAYCRSQGFERIRDLQGAIVR
ncbi:MAG: dihydroorotate dehydrogenase [Candidatus Sumerlaeia bacterium]|nr:dihydroorotate dehydrogenase [Candidatus Sumerlaeia bacterium]